MLRFYNTLSRQTEEFKPQDEKVVTIYSCGPTVYDFAHIGNFRANIFVDIIKRSLKYLGYEVKHVMNLTDVDDRIIDLAIEKKVSIEDYTEPYIQAFYEDLETLRIQKADYFPKATEHIKEMIEIVKKLEKNGYTYESKGSVYFNITKFKDYGILAGIDRNQLKDGARIDSDKYDKENAQDFALWKGKKEENEHSWQSPYGEGRPGWHLECSAMSMKYLGNTLDIHCGGEDLVFPHHTNEIAQSEGATGEKFVHYWLHCAHLQMGSEKMSKSLGNFFTLRDLLEKGYDPVTIRYTLLSTHYRSPLVFSFEMLDQSKAAIERLRDFKRRLERETLSGGKDENSQEILKESEEKFAAMLSDDLNISGAIGIVFTFVKTINKMLDDASLSEKGRTESLKLLHKFDEILDVLTEVSKDTDIAEEEINDLIEQRVAARKEKNWARADEIRDELLEKGIVLEDTPQGTIWKRK